MDLHFTHHGASLRLVAGELRRELSEGGFVLTRDADVALHFTPVAEFRGIPGKTNILWSADTRTPDLGPRTLNRLASVSAILVTGSLLGELLASTAQALKVPLRTVPLGFNPRVFRPLVRRREGGRPFRCLWFGEPDRYGDFGLLASMWSERFADQPWIELVAAMPGVVAQERGNVIFAAAPSDPVLRANMLHAAHCFIAFSHEHRVGLTTLEAIATGLPVVTSAWKPPIDFPLTHVTTCKYDIVYQRDGSEHVAADIGELGRNLERVVRDYDAAAQRAIDGALPVRSHFTWADSMRALRAALVDVVGVRAAA